MPIYTGETKDEAIEKGLKYLGVSKKNVKISIIQEPKKGFLGKFGKEAKVEITVLTDDYLEKRKKIIIYGALSAIVILLIIFFVYSTREDISSSVTKKSDSEIAVSQISSEISESEIESQSELSDEASSSETTEIETPAKLEYAVVKKDKKNIVSGDVSLTGGDGTQVTVEINEESIKPGTYQVNWTPGTFNGSDPDFGYGLIWINGDSNTIQIMPEETTLVTFNEGDSIIFQFAGKGTNDRIRLIEE